MVRGKYFAPAASPCFHGLREPPSQSTSFPESGQKNPSFPFLPLTKPMHASFLVGVHTGNLDSGYDTPSRNTNIRHETICILMFRAGTLLVSGQNSNVQKYVHAQGKTNNSHSHGLNCLTIASLAVYSDTSCWPTRRGERSRA